MEKTAKISGGKHASAECEQIAREGLIIQAPAGSRLHGIQIEATDDRDEIGICIEPPEYVIGLSTIENTPFGQYIYRTQAEGVPSGPGDLDLTVYSLRKWMRLATNGNPTILLTLFVPPGQLIVSTQIGQNLRAMAPRIVSQQAGQRFIGYMSQQRQSLDQPTSAARRYLVDAYGFDTKAAAHMVRLGWQGSELIRHGRLTLPMAEDQASWLRELREGRHTLAEAQREAHLAVRNIRDEMRTSPLPEQPDMDAVNAWMTAAYLTFWHERGI